MYGTMFVQELGKKAAVPSVYGLTFYVLGCEKFVGGWSLGRVAHGTICTLGASRGDVVTYTGSNPVGTLIWWCWIV